MSPEELKIEQFIPTDALKPYVKTFMIIESDKQTENRLLPDTSIVLAFRLKGRVIDWSQDGGSCLSSSVITGLRRSVRFLSYDDQTANLLVIFREGGAAALFKEPLHKFFSSSTPLDEFTPLGQLQLIEEQLNEAANNQQRVAVVERFLLSRINEKRTDQLVKHAMQQIRSVNGNIKIRSLAKSMVISIDPFEKRFRRVAGISPKQFAELFIQKLKDSDYNPIVSFLEDTSDQVIFEFRIEQPSNQIQDELQMITQDNQGLYVLNYVIKKADMGQENRQKWLQNLKNSSVKK